MSDHKVYNIQTYCIALVWIANGLFCKVFNLVPRHEQIVSRILGNSYSRMFTLFIGLSEIGMAIWILSGIKSRLNAIVQIFIIAIMNVMEYFLAADLLLWGKLNSLFAFLFIVCIYIHEFHFTKISNQKL